MIMSTLFQITPGKFYLTMSSESPNSPYSVILFCIMKFYSPKNSPSKSFLKVGFVAVENHLNPTTSEAEAGGCQI